MRLLSDQNLSRKLCRGLVDMFPGSTQTGLVALDNADDRAVWRFAQTNGYVLVSLDADFAEMAALLGAPPKLIWLRCGNQVTERIESCCATIAKRSLPSRRTTPLVWRFTDQLVLRSS